MKVLVSEKLSEHKYKTPEGYLICTDAILARTGKQSYVRDELFKDGSNEEIDVDRPYKEVMNSKTIASFENKPVTFDHPDEDVNVGNYKDYAIGYVRDVHQGKTDKGEDVILGNLVITDQDAINAIEQGDHTDLSCGYECDVISDDKGNYFQSNIRGNHVALCEQGRAGIAHIVDSKAKDDYSSFEKLRKDRDFMKKLKTLAKDAKNIKQLRQWLIDNQYFNQLSNAEIKLLLKHELGIDLKDFKKQAKFIEDGYTYKLTKKKNDYDEYVVQAYKDGKKYEGATYYTDDWDDAIGTMKMMAKREKLNFRQQGSVYIADTKEAKEMTMSDAVKMLNIVDAYKKASKKVRDVVAWSEYEKEANKIINDIIRYAKSIDKQAKVERKEIEKETDRSYSLFNVDIRTSKFRELEAYMKSKYSTNKFDKDPSYGWKPGTDDEHGTLRVGYLSSYKRKIDFNK